MSAPVPAAPGTHDPGPRAPSRYAVWAPDADRVEIGVRAHGAETTDVLALSRGAGGWWGLADRPARPGDRYAFRLDGEGPWLPDPRSLLQPEGVHGASEVVDVAALARHEPWRGIDLRGRTLYELHVGTFTPGPDGSGGTFDSAIERLDDLVALGVDAIEVMPVAAFPGDRGWGYDGVDLYATHLAYGGPQAFARFIAAAHERGLGVVLDVVYNHLGPDGNYLGAFGPYFTDAHHTPWGSAVNLDTDGSDEVRAFLLGNARQWLLDFDLDGLRLDAVHELRDDSPRHLLAELSDAVATWSDAVGRPLTLIAESDLNDPRMVTPTARGGLGMDMQWADDVHHAVHAWVTGEREGYYGDFGSAATLAKTLTRVFEHDGGYSSFRDRTWGAPVDPDSSAYDAHSFVAFLQDHDQVGNRAAGDRIDASVSPGQHAAATALILCGATTAMLFQGEEWGASTPFAYFTDHDEELGALVTAGRTEEFAKMDWADPVPDPQAVSTFRGSMLDWDERTRGDHARLLDWYTQLLHLVRREEALRDRSLAAVEVDVLSERTVVLRRGDLAVLAHRGTERLDLETAVGPVAEVLAAFDLDTAGDRPALAGPGAVVVRRAA
ncbi:malto-oligosyltrehalose trehalohydrolase [Brachybacterium huguangmaarense]|uniref:Malto-oligosyltrehalose trehalohydrolase n=1 Tax=Brachybacterium huguangmaarense TaxID=1652028 RepID=A0ABY6G076_9MICO|nr:malto-oligosyltrehalose trehalohydrolase [Brachybacterium huguangmaarense]UYG16542.1 malto-oligosyltrehalose trehalohydrolase [Brachybacterium huguangmaarense]